MAGKLCGERSRTDQGIGAIDQSLFLVGGNLAGFRRIKRILDFRHSQEVEDQSKVARIVIQEDPAASVPIKRIKPRHAKHHRKRRIFHLTECVECCLEHHAPNIDLDDASGIVVVIIAFVVFVVRFEAAAFADCPTQPPRALAVPPTFHRVFFCVSVLECSKFGWTCPRCSFCLKRKETVKDVKLCYYRQLMHFARAQKALVRTSLSLNLMRWIVGRVSTLTIIIITKETGQDESQFGWNTLVPSFRAGFLFVVHRKFHLHRYIRLVAVGSIRDRNQRSVSRIECRFEAHLHSRR